MDNKISTYSPAFSIVSWIALVGGIVTYLLGLWNAEMQLNEKGYYFAVLVLGLFSAASYQKTVRDKYEGWICPYISRHLLSLNPLLACCRRYSR
ncbi:YiaA/YiaB family inner membrane protein, partial [Escherichia coli]|uniref:YiaA/YiaB family inner membrane protein n=1 Tax=Escherichia coli TaxID=562 RepID=UPI001FF592F2